MAEKRFPTPCKHRLAVALNEAVLLAAGASDEEREAVEEEPDALLADGGEEHVEKCDDPACEGLQADGRPVLSFPCWSEWSSESHDWTDARRTLNVDQDTTPDEEDVEAIAVEQAYERGL